MEIAIVSSLGSAVVSRLLVPAGCGDAAYCLLDNEQRKENVHVYILHHLS
jgi:hypothetical protein